MMENFFIIGMWIVFALLGVYTFLSWKGKEFVKNTDTIRTSWYLIFIFGCLIYLTNKPNSLFLKWENFLIILISFIIVDSLVFLNLYITKFGGQELKMTEKQVSKVERYLDLTNNKITNMEKALNSYEYPSYTRDSEEYINELDKFFNAYAKLEFLNVDILPFRYHHEKEAALENLENVPFSKVKRILNSSDTYYSSKDSLMIMPIFVLRQNYVAVVTTLQQDVEVTEVDTRMINTLLMVYTLAVKVNNNNEGGDLL